MFAVMVHMLSVSQLMWVFDDEKSQMVQREITYVPGLYKIFDEILGMLWLLLKFRNWRL